MSINPGWGFVGLFSLFLLIIAAFLIYILVTYTTREYTVVDVGIFRVFNTDICAELPTCFGQNPDSPYARLIFESALNKPTPDSLLGAFYLDPNQAVIVSGITPPECRYFGFTAYLYREANGFIPFASLGDSINQTNLPFDSKFTLILSGSQSITESLVSQYGSNVWRLPIPMADTVKPGDQLMLVMRTAYFVDPVVGMNYLNNVPVNIVKIEYRLKDVNILYPRLPLYNRPIAPDERVHQTDFDSYVDSQLNRFRVLQAIDFHPFLYQYNYDSGYTCIDNNLECLGDNRDAAYLVSDTITIGPNQAILVFGTNHVVTGKAIYVSQSIYDQQIQYGLKSFSDMDLNPGQMFYTFAFTRRIIPNLDVPQYVISNLELELVTLAERGYVQPGYRVGSITDTLIWPRAFLVLIPLPTEIPT